MEVCSHGRAQKGVSEISPLLCLNFLLFSFLSILVRVLQTTEPIREVCVCVYETYIQREGVDFKELPGTSLFSLMLSTGLYEAHPYYEV